MIPDKPRIVIASGPQARAAIRRLAGPAAGLLRALRAPSLDGSGQALAMTTGFPDL